MNQDGPQYQRGPPQQPPQNAYQGQQGRMQQPPAQQPQQVPVEEPADEITTIVAGPYTLPDPFDDITELLDGDLDVTAETDTQYSQDPDRLYVNMAEYEINDDVTVIWNQVNNDTVRQQQAQNGIQPTVDADTYTLQIQYESTDDNLLHAVNARVHDQITDYTVDASDDMNPRYCQ